MRHEISECPGNEPGFPRPARKKGHVAQRREYMLDADGDPISGPG